MIGVRLIVKSACLFLVFTLTALFLILCQTCIESALAKPLDPQIVEGGSLPPATIPDMGIIEKQTNSPKYIADFNGALTKGMGFRYQSEKGAFIDFRITDFNPTPPLSIHDKVMYMLSRDADLIYTISKNKIKEDIVLRNKPANNTIRFDYKSSDLVAKSASDGYHLFDQNGDELFLIKNPTVIDAKGQAGPINLELKNSVAVLTIDKAFLDNAKYPITIDPTIVATSSNYVATGYSIQRKMMTTSEGSIVLFYQNGTDIVYKVSGDKGATWSDSINVSSSNSNDVSAFIDISDNIHIAYYNDANGRICYKKLTYNGDNSWDIGAESIIDSSGSTNRYVSIVKETSGRIWVSYLCINGSCSINIRNSNNDGATWSEASNLSSTNIWGSSQLILYDDHAVCFYEVDDNSLRWRRWDGSTWQSETTIVSGQDYDDYNWGSVAVAGDSIHLIYTKYNGGDIKHTLFNGSTWSTPVNIQTATSDRYPSLTTDGLNLWAFWGQSLGNGQYRTVHKKFNGSSWDTNPIVISNSSGHNFDKVWTYLNSVPWSDSTYSDLVFKFYDGSTYMGNQLGQNNTSYDLDSTDKKASIKFVADASKPLDKFTLYASKTGTSPIYRFGIQGDSGGYPNGSWLNGNAYVDQQVSTSNWKMLDIPNVNLTSGTTYHLVVQYQSGTINSSNKASISYIAPNFTSTERVCTYNGSSWSTLDAEPSYVLTYSDASTEGQSIQQAMDTTVNSPTLIVGEKFVCSSSYTPTSLAIYGNRYGTPTGNLLVKVYDSSDNQLFSGTIGTPTSPTTPSWLTVPVSGLTLTGGSTYRVVVHANGVNSTNYYKIRFGWTSSYHPLTWGGNNNCYTATYSWTGWNDETTDASSINGSDVQVFGSVNDALYLGLNEPFNYIYFNLGTLANPSVQPTWQYWNGSTWQNLTLIENSNYGFTAGGAVSFAAPPDWQQTGVNGSTQYWIKIVRTASSLSIPPILTQITPIGKNVYATTSTRVSSFDIPVIWTEGFGSTYNLRYYKIPGPYSNELGLESSYKYAERNLSSGSSISANQYNGNLVLKRTNYSIPGRGLPDTIIRTYNSQAIQDGRFGYGWTLNYGSRVQDGGTGVWLIDGDGSEHFFTSNTDGSYNHPPGIYLTMTKNIDATYTVKANDQTRYNYDAYGRLSTIVDKNGNTQILTYDANSKLTNIQDTSSRNITFTYNGNGKLASITDFDSRTTIFAYDDNGNLISETNPMGEITLYSYDTEHNLLSITDPKAALTAFSYSSDRLISATGLISNITYESNKTNIFDARGKKFTYWFNASGACIAQTDPLNQETAYTLDDNFNCIRIMDALSRERLSTFDINGNVTSVTVATGNATYMQYDENNNLTGLTDANGKLTDFNYDENGNLTEKTDPLLNKTTYAYDGCGQKTSETDARGFITYFYYSSNGDLISVFDPLCGIQEYTYDNRGNKLTEIDKRGHTTQFTYDLMDRLLSTQAPAPFNYLITNAYDALGNKLRTTDASGNITAYEYDSLSQLASERNVLGDTVHYYYDAAGNKISESKTASPTQIAGFETTEIWSYGLADTDVFQEGAQALTLTSTNGQEISTTMDRSSNPMNLSDGEAFSIWLNPNDFSNLESLKIYFYSGEFSYFEPIEGSSWDACFKSSGLPGWIRFEPTKDNFSPVGSPAPDWASISKVKIAIKAKPTQSITVTFDDWRLTKNIKDTEFAYDDAGRLTSSTNPLGASTSYIYDAVGNKTAMTDANQHTTDYVYDGLNRMVKVTDALDKETEFEYDVLGNKTKETDANDHFTTYTYDEMGRLESVIDAKQNAQQNPKPTVYEYDDFGNKVGITKPKGNETKYEYDALNRLVSETNALGLVTSYAYDADGNQISSYYSMGTGSEGLLGEYFNQDNLTESVFTRTDPIIDFSWGNGSPNSSMEGDYFSIRWTGQVLADENDTYTFYTMTDDGVRLYVDDVLIIDKWNDYLEQTGTRVLTKGWHNIKMEYNEKGGIAFAQLSYSSGSINKEIIPKTHLRPPQLENASSIAVSGFESSENWEAVDGFGGTVSADTVNYKEGSQGLKLSAADGEVAFAEAIVDTGPTTELFSKTNVDSQTWDSAAVNSSDEIGNYGYEAQQFVATQSGMATHARLFVKKVNRWQPQYGSSGYLRIKTGNPNGTVIAEKYITSDDIPDTAGWTTFAFDTVGMLIYGNTYYFTFEDENPNHDLNHSLAEWYYCSDGAGNWEKDFPLTGSWTFKNNKHFTLEVLQQSLDLATGYDDSDLIEASIYIDDVGNTDGIYMMFESSDGSYFGTRNLKYYGYASSDGWNHVFLPKSRFTEIGDPNWESIRKLKVMVVTTDGHDTVNVTFDDWRLSKGCTKTSEYDALNRKTEEKDPLGNTNKYFYDGRGNQIAVVNPKNKTSHKEYNAANRLIAAIDEEGNSTQYEYDDAGNTVKVVDPNNGVTETVYDQAGRPTSKKDALGNIIYYEYDDVGNQTVVKDASNTTTTNTYDELNRLASKTQSGQTTQYEYDNLGNKTTETSTTQGIPGSRVTEYEYDELNRLTETNYPDDSWVRITFDDNGNQTSQADPNGTIEYTYDLADRLIKITEPSGKTTEYILNQGDNKTKIYDPALNINVTYERNKADQLSKIIDSNERQTVYDYDENSNKNSLTNANGVETQYGYSDSGDLTSLATQAPGSPPSSICSFSYEYDANGNRTNITEGTQSTHYEYDNANQLTDIVYPSGTQTSYSYGSTGNRESETATDSTAGSKKTDYSYNSRNELESAVVDYDGEVSLYSKTNVDSQTWDSVAVNSSPEVYNFGYEAQEFVAKKSGIATHARIFVKKVNRWQPQYGSEGYLRIRTGNPKDGEIIAQKHITTLDIPDQGSWTTFAFDTIGNLVANNTYYFTFEDTNPNHDLNHSLAEWYYCFDGTGSQQQDCPTAGPWTATSKHFTLEILQKPSASSITLFSKINVDTQTWDSAAVNSSNEISNYGYEAQQFEATNTGVATHVKMFLNKSRYATGNSSGYIRLRTGGVEGDVIAEKYVTNNDIPSAGWYTFAFDTVGMLVSGSTYYCTFEDVSPEHNLSHSIAEWYYCFDGAGNWEKDFPLTGSWTFKNDKHFTLEIKQQQIQPTLYSKTNVNTSDLVGVNSWDGDGQGGWQAQQFVATQSGKATHARLYVKRHQSSSQGYIRIRSGSTTGTIVCERFVTDYNMPQTAGWTTFAFTKIGWLTSGTTYYLTFEDTNPNHDTEHSLADWYFCTNGNGNYEKDRALSGPWIFRNNKHFAMEIIQKDITRTYDYDERGNLTSKVDEAQGTTTYTWNDLDKLTGMTRWDGAQISFTYNAQGRRFSKTAAGTTTYYIYDGNNLTTELNGSFQVTATYLYDDKGSPVQVTRGTDTYYYHLDGHGSVAKITDQNKNVVASYSYDAWGNITASSGSFADSQPFRYAGYLYDSETGLYYLINRYYDPKDGRFISKDPMQETAPADNLDANKYLYVKNDPVNATDPSGLTAGGSIYGRVLDIENRKAIPGTVVRCDATVIPTNANGEFRFTMVVPKSSPNGYTIFYDAPGYISQIQENITVADGVETTCPTVLMSREGSPNPPGKSASLDSEVFIVQSTQFSLELPSELDSRDLRIAIASQVSAIATKKGLALVDALPLALKKVVPSLEIAGSRVIGGAAGVIVFELAFPASTISAEEEAKLMAEYRSNKGKPNHPDPRTIEESKKNLSNNRKPPPLDPGKKQFPPDDPEKPNKVGLIVQLVGQVLDFLGRYF